MDSYTEAYIRTNIRIDSGSRVWLNDVQLPVVFAQKERKVQLPISQILYTFEDLKRAGARCDVITLKTLAQAGAYGRWKDRAIERARDGLPANVYVANARTVQLAIDAGEIPPPVRWIGRVGRQMTETRDTIDEVLDDMANDRWKTKFIRGRHAPRK